MVFVASFGFFRCANAFLPLDAALEVVVFSSLSSWATRSFGPAKRVNACHTQLGVRLHDWQSWQLMLQLLCTQQAWSWFRIGDGKLTLNLDNNQLQLPVHWTWTGTVINLKSTRFHRQLPGGSLAVEGFQHIYLVGSTTTWHHDRTWPESGGRSENGMAALAGSWEAPFSKQPEEVSVGDTPGPKFESKR